GIDATRDDELAGRVDHARALGRQRPRRDERGDALAFDADVPGADTIRSHDLSAANDEIEHHEPPLAVPEHGPETPICEATHPTAADRAAAPLRLAALQSWALHKPA